MTKIRLSATVVLCGCLLAVSTAGNAQAQHPNQPLYAPAPPHAYPQYTPHATPQYTPYQQPPPPYAPYPTQILPPQPAPDGDDDSTGTGLLIGGTITLGSFYLASVLSGAALSEACDATIDHEDLPDVEISVCGEANTDLTYIPVAGPFVAMAELTDTELEVWPLSVALAGVGIGQITGLALLIGGAIASNGSPKPKKPAPVTVQPTFGPHGAAVSLIGSF